MFGDYPVEGRRYWLWIAGLVGLGLASLVIAIALR
jgi:hypothetical protein